MITLLAFAALALWALIAIIELVSRSGYERNPTRNR